jgi:hypothetical protein
MMANAEASLLGTFLAFGSLFGSSSEREIAERVNETRKM